MNSESESLFFLGAGPLAAVLLGMLLIPLRETTSASNLTFLFLALVIAVAEVSGRRAAIATAVSSSLSLNFFLTQPYLKLTIHSRDDVIAVFGLALCGLIAASLGSRGRTVRELAEAREQMELLHRTARELAQGGPIESRLGRLLSAAGSVFPISSAVVRDGHGRILGASDTRPDSRRIPETVLDLDAALASREGRASLPADGARLELVLGNSRVGWLDLWGDGRTANQSTRRALGDFAKLTAALVAEKGMRG